MNTKATLTILFGVSIAIANVTAAKLAWFALPVLGGVAVPAGFLAFGVAFLCSDLLVEFHGPEYAHDVVNGTVVALVAAWGLVHLSILMPTAPFYGDAAAFQSVLGSGTGIVAASVITILVSQHVDVGVFADIRERTGGRHKWARNVGSTATSQGIDTVLFITLAFAVFPALQGGEVLWGVPLALTTVGQYVVKLAVAVLDTPVFYAATALRDWNSDQRAARPEAQ